MTKETRTGNELARAIPASEKNNLKGRGRRKNISISLFLAWLCQLLAVNILFVLIGLRILKVTPRVVAVFTIVVTVEIVVIAIVSLQCLLRRQRNKIQLSKDTVL